MVVTCLKAILSLVVACLLFVCIFLTKDNKVAMHRMFSYDTIGQVERELTRKDQANFYVPVYRLAFSAFANHLASHQLVQLKAASGKIQIDSCSYRVPNIVLFMVMKSLQHLSRRRWLRRVVWCPLPMWWLHGISRVLSSSTSCHFMR